MFNWILNQPAFSLLLLGALVTSLFTGSSLILPLLVFCIGLSTMGLMNVLSRWVPKRTFAYGQAVGIVSVIIYIVYFCGTMSAHTALLLVTTAVVMHPLSGRRFRLSETGDRNHLPR